MKAKILFANTKKGKLKMFNSVLVILTATLCLCLAPSMDTPAYAEEQPVKSGLVAVFFNSSDFTRPRGFSIDSQVSMNTRNKHHDYSMLWIGLFNTPVTGEITFHAEADNGLQLTVGKKTVIDGWGPDYAREGKLTAKKDEQLPMVLKYFQFGGTAHMRLYWSWEGRSRELIPLSAFRHREADVEQARKLLTGKAAVEVPKVRPGAIYAPSGPSSGRHADSAEPIQLRAGPHLFIDDFLIESSVNLTRKVNALKRDPSIPNPVIHGRAGKGDKNFQPYVSVHRDQETKRFRVWYNVGVNPTKSLLGYMESEDGIHWIRPHRELDKPDDIAYGACVLDEGRDFPDPDKRYKLVYYSGELGGMRIAVSADGIQWTPIAPGLQLPNVGDIVYMTHDSSRDCYIAVFKLNAMPADGYVGRAPKGGIRRIVGQSVSKDLVHWSPPRRIIMPGDKDEGITEFYSIGGLLIRGDLLIGMLKVLRDDLPCNPDGPVEGIGYTVLTWTRDRENWVRDKDRFLARDYTPGAWDHAHAWVDCQLPVGDEIYLYYGGYKSGHKVNRFEERQIGLVKMKRDRYVAREAGEKTATLRTPLVILHGEQITLNADARGGEVRIQILGTEGKPIPGFSFTDCRVITGDNLSAPVRWGRALAGLKGKTVQIEFLLKRARLFAFYLE